MRILATVLAAALAGCAAQPSAPATAVPADPGTPVAIATSNQGDVVTLYNGACALRSRVTNLPLRATWRNAERTFEGCFTISNSFVVGYWDDGSVSMTATHHFRPVEVH